MRVSYYIPGQVDGISVYVRIAGREAEILPADRVDVDPFSRVVAPRLRPGWAEDLGLTEEERQAFEAVEVAYTRAVVRR